MGLETNGFICLHPEQDNEVFLPTELGRSIQDHSQLQTVISGAQLPEEFLHRDLLLHARPLFLQSRFETAVFEAFKSLEVAISEAVNAPDGLFGAKLAQYAFNPDDGPLTDLGVDKSEA
ncbi:hypothetical protein JI739_17215 [Ramlibacter sp. AW1]|uniref:Conserved hypothetical protein CHP02391 domain-containing protein n=1 Tax=Ramlibacter aurantiacus TaxID=2801330 RepID=A0A937D7J8_9BURK|nr:TIGR02391 family protein [Ramlibacter aurantiacus]MBL0422093.1 hypothetical protein [Ramlibacter aurantiacus]